MGCWSESCLVSGLEIQPGDECYAFEGIYGEHASPHDSWAMSSPVVFGTYDDYGGVDVTRPCVLMGLSVGDNWCPEGRFDVNRGVFFVHARAKKTLETLPMDFPYLNSQKYENLGTWADALKANTREKLQKALDGRLLVDDETMARITENDGEREAVLFRARLFSNFEYEVLDGGYNVTSYAGLQTALCDYLGDTHKLGREEWLNAYHENGRISTMIFRGCTELRRPFAPVEQAPQHCGHEALCHMSRAILEFEEERNRGDESD